jgi:methyl-accepting chemotaxis protein
VRAKEIIVLTDQAVQFGQADQDEQATATLAKADALILPMANDTAAFLDQLTKDVVLQSDGLTEQTDSTILMSLLVVGISFALGIIAALIVAAKGITTPIANLRERMMTLAQGQTAAPVDGQDRRDEVGQMAQAVSIFRDNALEKIRLEQETEANRSVSEKERIEREAQKTRDAADTQFAVDQLAKGLDRLAEGDVAYRIDTPFVTHLDTLRNNFNGSVANLNDALRAVGQNARGIDAGANEIRSAADDLSKRTEQQAAALEETSAALDEITAVVQNSTERAQEATVMVSEAKDKSGKSGVVVRNAVDAMGRIEQAVANGRDGGKRDVVVSVGDRPQRQVPAVVADDDESHGRGGGDAADDRGNRQCSGRRS